ncbi:BspA family leucine-rich repeat surface protein [Mycoplasmopsis agalactiae]|uniref:BspA family leucine-rich repeat surface protein n=1 Tax=Mycoplasmopsis agalactiae TaxID=2110 RepID=UPI00211BF782|nr:BspA family leucine-rich repeat surface protein [Mycoplasmopsis agalactiae]UUM25226.1 BspA family leucine-rich repeat surface protein [Mycoplasmopsis agalactiae]
MKKKIKILTSLSLSLVSLPLIAASCKKRDENKSDMSGAITEENTNPKNDTPPLNNNDNMDNMNDSTTHSNSEQGDQADNSENNGGTYAMPHTIEEAKRIQEEAAKTKEEEKRKQEEAARKEKEAQEAKDKKDVQTVKDIVKVHEDAFGSFHTQGEFLDQIALYANEQGVSDLSLANNGDANKKLTVDTDGNGKNNIKLKLRSQNFEVKLGKVLQDAVITKYYFEDKKENILTNYSETIKTADRSWRIILKEKMGKKIVVTQLGYHKDHNYISLSLIPYHTVKVPANLPIKINSLLASFQNLESKTIENLEKWDITNVVTLEQAFLNAKNFEQDLSKWTPKENANVNGTFKLVKGITNNLEKIAKAWKVDKNKLTK